MKKTFYRELAYFLGITILAFGTALMTKGDFGLASIVAPAYILHVKISEFLPFFSFGMAEYTLQAVILVILALVVRKFKISYLLSFVTAVFYGFMLDLFVFLTSFIPGDVLAIRLVVYIVGFLINTFSIAFLFQSYIPPEAYELFVMDVADNFGLKKSKFKVIYDVASLALSLILSFVFFGFGKFVGINVGTVLTAFLNGFLIQFFSNILTKRYEFKPASQKLFNFVSRH